MAVILNGQFVQIFDFLMHFYRIIVQNVLI